MPFCYEQNTPLGVYTYAIGCVLSVPEHFFLSTKNGIKKSAVKKATFLQLILYLTKSAIICA